MSDSASSTTLGILFSGSMIAPTSNSCCASSASASADDREARQQAVLNCLLDSDQQCMISYWLYVISIPALIAGGTVGNALTIVVMATKAMGKTAFGTYIAAIAIADILVLWTTLPRHFVRWIWLVDIRNLNPWSCRILRFLQFSLMNTSAWLLVTVTVERFLNVYYPTKFRLYKTRSRALRVVSGTAVFHFAWNVHIFWTLGEQRLKDGTTRACGYPNAEAVYYWTQAHAWIDLVKLSLLPFVIMLSLNVAIMVSLRERAVAKRHGRILPGLKGLRLRPLGDGSSRVARSAARFKCSSAGERSVGAAATHLSSSASADKTKTLMLLWVSFFYVVATVPTFVSTVLDNAKRGNPLFASFATIVLYVNNAANFLLYSLSGATFRRMLSATLKRRSRSASWSSSVSRRSTTTFLSAGASERAAENGQDGQPPSVQLLQLPPVSQLEQHQPAQSPLSPKVIASVRVGATEQWSSNVNESSEGAIDLNTSQADTPPSLSCDSFPLPAAEPQAST